MCQLTSAFTAALKFRTILDCLIQCGSQCIGIIDRYQPAGVAVLYHSPHTFQIGGDHGQPTSQRLHHDIRTALRSAGKNEYVRLRNILRHICCRHGIHEREM
ncbi:MAG: hypothetical protein BGP10_11100 [Rhodanobacter sp. 68-29]|nr:MAG: hypothetical protein ABT17_01360 [Rhodanobacter sp. SCN 69-32]OJY62302.1 MAG: hypothetical protein BGP10_11100 [Rhodanobacter sp. 68-29]